MLEAILVTTAAGIGGTGIGGGGACLFRRGSGRLTSLLLSFAGGVMVSVVCFGLLTDAASANAPALLTLGVLSGCGVTAALNGLLAREREGLLLAGLVMAAAIAVHNVPEGMSIAAPLLTGGSRPAGAVGVTALSGLPTILGALLGYTAGVMNPVMLSVSLGFAAGAMLYVVFGELLPESAGLWNSRVPALSAVLGVLVGMVIGD